MRYITPERTYDIPYGACNVDHEQGKTKWQRIAEVLDTPEGDDGLFWEKHRSKADWVAGRAVTLTEWELALGGDREYGSNLGPNRWNMWIKIGPFSWWLTREWPATMDQMR